MSLNGNEIARPLSTYDNLNTINTNESKTTATSTTDTNGITNNGNHKNHTNQNADEFPFNGISFRFDEIKQNQSENVTPTTYSSNGYDNINNNEYENHRNNNTNVNHHNNLNGIKKNRQNQGYTVTTIAQNHSGSNSLSSSSEINGKKLYDNPTNKSLMKPVHSEAKSQFLGLNTPNDENIEVFSKLKLEKPINGNDELDSGESMIASEEEPLINKLNCNRIGSNRPATSLQYQNIPNNSACYGQNQIIDANNACTCRTNDDANDTEIRSMESDKYKCDSCMDNNNGVDVPTTSIDLTSCSTSMKSTRPITLSSSSNYRMSQSLSQVKSIIVGT